MFCFCTSGLDKQLFSERNRGPDRPLGGALALNPRSRAQTDPLRSSASSPRTEGTGSCGRYGPGWLGAGRQCVSFGALCQARETRLKSARWERIGQLRKAPPVPQPPPYTAPRRWRASHSGISFDLPCSPQQPSASIFNSLPQLAKEAPPHPTPMSGEIK